MDLLDELSIEDLNEEQRELADMLGGWEIYKNFIRNFGGSNVYAVLPETLTVEVRNKHIKAEFNGKNYLQLGRKYHLSDRQIRKIIDKK